MQILRTFPSLRLTNNDVISAILKKKKKSQMCNIKCQYYRMTMNLQAYRIKDKMGAKNIKISSELNVAWFN